MLISKIKRIQQIKKQLDSLYDKEVCLFNELAEIGKTCDHKFRSGRSAQTISSNGLKHCGICGVWPMQ